MSEVERLAPVEWIRDLATWHRKNAELERDADIRQFHINAATQVDLLREKALCDCGREKFGGCNVCDNDE
jgi:hypothetical protein